jgi:hypothetical protein
MHASLPQTTVDCKVILLALLAADAFMRIECVLRLECDILRIVTPHATQGAPLEKDGSADTRPVVHGHAFDVGDACGHFFTSVGFA